MNIYMMIGYSGCGKTTYAKQLAEKKNAKVFCADDIFRRNHKEGMTSRKNKERTEAEEWAKISYAIAQNINLVLDGNFLSFATRSRIFLAIELLREKVIKRIGKNVNVNVIAVHINNEWEECTINRIGRDGAEWKSDKNKFDHKDVPLLSEGFSAIKTIHNDYINKVV